MLFIDYVNVLFSSNSQRQAGLNPDLICCLSIMSMFSFQAIHNRSVHLALILSVVYRLCQCSLFKQFTTQDYYLWSRFSCLSIMSMFSFQAIHNSAGVYSRCWFVVYRLCQCSLFKQFTTGIVDKNGNRMLFIDYVNVLFSSNSQLPSIVWTVIRCCLSIMSMFSFQAIHNGMCQLFSVCLVVYRLCQCSLFKQFTTDERTWTIL